MMDSRRKTARWAGFLYLLVGITGAFGLVYVPSKLVVSGNATATANNILASQWLFRLGIVSQLISPVVFIFLVMALYRLLKEVNQRQASLMVVLVLVQVPIAFLNEVNAMASLLLVRGGDFLAVFDKPQRDALAMLFARLHTQGIFVNQMFWGLWLFPFGLLVWRSGFLPRWLGGWLVINGVAYVAECLVGMLLPSYYSVVSKVAFPALLGEMVAIFWLLIVGAKAERRALAQSAGG
jgi:hypothetical protein